ncbi:MAG: hypothetical protein M1335_00505, partial [Chloroflexi bacterium]|nr:hypothetical protein [Chloroflexota bacterium]
EAKGRYLVFLHNDVLVSPGWLEAILRPFGDRRVACACPSFMESQLKLDFPKLAVDFSQILPAYWPGSLTPFCFAISRREIHRIGPFDEALTQGPYADYDLLFRLAKADAPPVVVSNVLVHHFWGQTAVAIPEFYGENDERDWLYFRKKWNLPPMERKSEDPDFIDRVRGMDRVVVPTGPPDYRVEIEKRVAPTKPTRIVACVSFYNDMKLLPGCMETLDGVDEIVLIDGAYAGFPHEVPWSTDGSLEWIKELQRVDPRIRLIECERAWEDEVKKRSAYFAGGDGDWCLVIDSDERLVGNEANHMERLKEYLAVYPFDCVLLDVETRPSTTPMERYARIYRHLPGLRYETTHFNVVADGKKVTLDAMWSGRTAVYRGLFIVHLKQDRGSARLGDSWRYYQEMAMREVEALKREIVACWSDPDRRFERLALVQIYQTQVKLLDKERAERIALDPKYLSFHLDTSGGYV